MKNVGRRPERHTSRRSSRLVTSGLACQAKAGSSLPRLGPRPPRACFAGRGPGAKCSARLTRLRSSMASHCRRRGRRVEASESLAQSGGVRREVERIVIVCRDTEAARERGRLDTELGRVRAAGGSRGETPRGPPRSTARGLRQCCQAWCHPLYTTSMHRGEQRPGGRRLRIPRGAARRGGDVSVGL